MRLPTLAAGLLVTAWTLVGVGNLFAQGVTTAAIQGTVLAADSTDVDGTRISVEHQPTGVRVETAVQHNRFLVEGLEPGGPYSITLQRLGLGLQRHEGLYLTLGEPLVLRFILQPSPIALPTLHVVGAPEANVSGGTGTTIPDSLLHRLPTMNRTLYDFVALVPQVTTGIGLSGGGVGFRYNNFLIQGVPERSLLGNQPPEFAGGRSMPLAAVSEYQVLLAPYDVRYGDFAGALVSTVTRSGTSERQGTAFAFARSGGMGRGVATGGLPFQRLQAGFSTGGPLVRGRLHYFIAPEIQRFTSRAPGPYVGQSSGAVPQVPIDERDLARLDEILGRYGLAAGSGGAVETSNDALGLFTRIDLALPEWNGRSVIWLNANRSRDRAFARPPSGAFPLSTNAATHGFGARTTGLQLHTSLRRPGGGHNSLLVSHRANWSESIPDVRQPVIRVTAPSTTGGTVTVVTGTPLPAQGAYLESSDLNARNHLTLPFAKSHVAIFGVEAEWFRVRGRGPLNVYGAWTFSGLDALEQGTASRFELERDFGSASAPLSGAHYAVYAGDSWQAGDRVVLTLGLRAEALSLRRHAPYNASIDSVYGRRTDLVPASHPHLSPRASVVWDVFGTGRDQLRGGIGVFTARPPLAWLHSALIRHGIGVGLLRCGFTSTDLGPPPPFEPDYRSPPTTCGGDVSLASAPAGDVDLLDSRLRMAQTLRTTLGWDRRLPWGMVGTVEALVTRNTSDLAFINLNLHEPQGVDRNRRVMYGTIGADGSATPHLHSDSFPSVIALENSSRNRSYQISARMEKRFSAGAALTASYTFSRVRDVQTPLRVNLPGAVNWSTGRPVSGRHDDPRTGVSLNEVPHRIVVAGTYRTPVHGWATEVSMIYMGEAGHPFTYVTWGNRDRGDLNADGSAVNDPIYVPVSAYDLEEIRFSGPEERISAQQAALERFIESTPCLDRQRGRIMQRNSCRAPWSHTTMVSVRQSLPTAGHRLEIQLDLFNLLNLLDADWGLRRVPSTGCGTCSEAWTRWTGSPALLEHAGQVTGPLEQAQPLFRFDETTPRWVAVQPESAYQIQLGLVYRF